MECHYYDGQSVNGSDPDLIAEWPSNETPKLWRDMSDQEKVALLLAAHEGKVIECWQKGDTPEYWAEVDPSWADNCAYRIRPEPKRETVTMEGACFDGVWRMSQAGFIGAHTHRITFNTIDGKPDHASIRMDEI